LGTCGIGALERFEVTGDVREGSREGSKSPGTFVNGSRERSKSSGTFVNGSWERSKSSGTFVNGSRDVTPPWVSGSKSNRSGLFKGVVVVVPGFPSDGAMSVYPRGPATVDALVELDGVPFGCRMGEVVGSF
jgi:hypothetical protein